MVYFAIRLAPEPSDAAKKLHRLWGAVVFFFAHFEGSKAGSLREKMFGSREKGSLVSGERDDLSARELCSLRDFLHCKT